MSIFSKLRWRRVGYLDGRIRMSASQTRGEELFVARSILYEREPFLWFKTRKAKEIGDNKAISDRGCSSAHHNEYKRNVEDWLLGGKIEYVRENGTGEPAKVLRLVRDGD